MIIKEISRGITHIEDLDTNDFQKLLENISEYGITEKVDGAQILFGLDQHGFYTSRETKGGNRIYSVHDYDVTFTTSYMRSAHTVLEQVLPQLRTAGLRPGDQVEAEVLYGELPNVVPYSADTNYLIFLRTTEGTVNTARLGKILNNTRHNISILSPFTDDGKSIQLREEAAKWAFESVPKYLVDMGNIMQGIEPLMQCLTRFSNRPSGISGQSIKVIESTPLNKIPVWCHQSDWKLTKELIREKKFVIDARMGVIKMAIKNKLLDSLVRSRGSSFGPLHEEGGWIEGVVLRHKTTGKMVKLVDKDVFGPIREAAWRKRNMLTEHAKSPDGNLSILGRLYVGMATALGHPSLGTIHAKGYIRKAGSINEERVTNLTSGLDYSSIKDYWCSLLESALQTLETDLDEYENDTYKAHAVMEITRTDLAIYQRTMQTYAYMFEKIEKLKETTSQAKNISDILAVIAGKQLKDLT